MQHASITRTMLAGIALIFVGLASQPGDARAAKSMSAREVHAAYLFNFVRYVRWPESAFSDASSPVRLCVLGDSDFIDIASESIDGKKVGARPVIVEPTPDVLGAFGCHILYLDGSQKSSESEVVATFARRSVLTVSGSIGFAEMGGVANFVTVGNKVRFVINKGAADKAGLEISSRLLRIAQVVH